MVAYPQSSTMSYPFQFYANAQDSPAAGQPAGAYGAQPGGPYGSQAGSPMGFGGAAPPMGTVQQGGAAPLDSFPSPAGGQQSGGQPSGTIIGTPSSKKMSSKKLVSKKVSKKKGCC